MSANTHKQRILDVIPYGGALMLSEIANAIGSSTKIAQVILASMLRRNLVTRSKNLTGRYVYSHGPASDRRTGKQAVLDAFAQGGMAAVLLEIENAVYATANGWTEGAEFAGHHRGNGHHTAQEIAAFAVKLMKDRWQR